MCIEDFHPSPNFRQLPPAYDGCMCDCHRIPGVTHIAPCCSPPEAGDPDSLIEDYWFLESVLGEDSGD